MRGYRRGAALGLAALLLAGPASPGRLDLDLYASARVPAWPSAAPGFMPKDRWLPGDPRQARGESFAVQALADSGNAAMGAVGLAQSLPGARRSRDAQAAAVGFGLISLWNLWRLLTLTTDEPKKKP